MSADAIGIIFGLALAAVTFFGVLALAMARASQRRGTCAWYVRGYHARQRQIDIQGMWTLLQGAARAHSQPRTSVVEAWRMFRQLPGQEHWHCPCGRVAHTLFEARVITPYLER